MKKYLLLLLLALTLTITCACEKEIENDKPSISEDEKELNLPYPNAIPESNPTVLDKLDVDLSKDELDNEDIINAYLYANKISFFMNVATLDNLDYQDKVEKTNEANGFVMDYYKSNDFNTYEEFKNYINAVFDEKMTDELLKNSSYINYDDMLYIIPAGRGTNIFALSDTYKIEKENNKITIKVATGFLNDIDYDGNMKTDPDYYEYNDFTLEHTKDGWRFTSFPVIR